MPEADPARPARRCSEGLQRTGRDRLHHRRGAAGSAAETVACLRVAQAWGDLDAAAAPLASLGRVRAILWRLTR